MTLKAGMALSLAAALVLTGCGTSQEEEYCAALKDRQAAFGDLAASTDPGALFDAVPMLRTLADRAPDDLVDEWQTFLNALTGLRDAMRGAGVRPEDFRGGRIPDRVPRAERADLAAAADALTSDDVRSAARGIERQARDVCKVDLGL